MKQHSLKQRAIRGAWQVARKGGINAQMSQDAEVRRAVVNAWLAGYRQGRSFERDVARARAGGAR